MSTTISQDRKLSDAFGKKSKTAVSKYDLVSGFLMAAVGLVSFVTGLLFLLFLFLCSPSPASSLEKKVSDRPVGIS